MCAFINIFPNLLIFQFMNLVLDETVEVVSTTEKTDIGMVVRISYDSAVLPFVRLFVETILFVGTVL